MSATDSMSQTFKPGDTVIILSEDSYAKVPEGADPVTFRKVKEAGLRLAAPSAKRKRQPRRSGKPKKSVNYAESILWTHNAFAEVLK